MTDSEIIEALECCVGEKRRQCSKCPCDRYGSKTLAECRGILLGHTLDSIKHQQAEIERLEAEKDNLILNYKECAMEAVKDFAERLKERVKERAYEQLDDLPDTTYMRVGAREIDEIDECVSEMEEK